MNFRRLNFNSIYRFALYVAVAVVGVLLWNAWSKEHSGISPFAQSRTKNIAASSGSFVPPNNPAPLLPATHSPAEVATKPPKMVEVKTDVLDVDINLQGGDLANARLLKYNESLENSVPMTILSSDPDSLHIASTGLKQNDAAQPETINYQSSQTQYRLPEGQDSLTVQLAGTTSSGLQIIKTFVFERNKYNIEVNYQLRNSSNTPWVGNIYKQITRKDVPPRGSQNTHSFNGAAVSSPDKLYEKLPFKKLNEMQISRNVQGGWLAMQQPYFLSAWIPPDNQMNHYYSNVVDNTYTLGYVGPQLNIPPGSEITQKSMFYVGPELPDNLKNLAKGLDLTIDYGWLWMISKLIFWVMAHIESVVKNWGVAIIVTTLIIKLVFYKLSEKSYVSMAKMREIQPRLQALKDRYGEDKAALSRATMEFYKKEKINPLGGCLPTLIQIPVFIALYYVLIESVGLRQAQFLWIKDLSIHDPYYILPVLMGISMFLQQRLSPPPPDPTQAKIMMFLPVIFTVFFLNFPAGLVLYWLVNNCASILQQWYVMKFYKKSTSPVALSKKLKKILGK